MIHGARKYYLFFSISKFHAFEAYHHLCNPFLVVQMSQNDLRDLPLSDFRSFIIRGLILILKTINFNRYNRQLHQ